MSHLDHAETRFIGSSDEAPELEDYRPISPLVIVACIAGALSLLAVVHPLLWVLPVAAIVLSVCAIRQVSATHRRYSGRPAAVVALSFAVLVGTYAPARAISLERELYARAVPQVKSWVSLIQQGRFQEAHQFTLGVHERFQGPGSLSNHYLPPGAKNQTDKSTLDPADSEAAEMLMESGASDRLAEFIRNPLVAAIHAYGPTATVSHVQNIATGNDRGNVKVAQRYRVSGLRDGQPAATEFLVTAVRWELLGHANWEFRGYREVP